MTGGVVLVIGEVGRNFGAGMTGGVAYVWDPAMNLKARLADTAPAARRPSESDLAQIRSLVEEHHAATSSPASHRILEEWSAEQGSFWVVSNGGGKRTLAVVESAEVPATP